MPVFKLNDVFAGRYVLSELIGEGNFTEVWKAKDQMADGTEVALKIYAPDKELDDLVVSKFRQEYSLSQYFAHPHLLQAYHFDISEGSPYLVMPFCSMVPLSRLPGEEGFYSERQVALVLCQIGSALEKLHCQEPPILHQDIQPDNILVSQADHFYLANFGINSQIRPASRNAIAKSKSVRQAYAPPEFFDPHQPNDASGDIFSLGVTLFEKCTGTLPWDVSGGPGIVKGGNVPNLPKNYPAELNELLQACMSNFKTKRPTAAELHKRGKHFLEKGNWKLPEKGKSLKTLMPFLLGAAVLLFLAISAFWVYQNDHLTVPAERVQKMATSADANLDPESGQNAELDEMLIVVLEEELKDLAKRNQELEEANKQLMQNDSENKVLLKEQEQLLKKSQNQFPEKDQLKSSSTIEKKPVVSVSVAPPKEDNNALLPKDLEQQLNKISDPKISGKARETWKKETMAQFATSAVRILDETDGIPKQYSASIFLNLLYNVPHNIVVKEVKRNQSRKVTEVRLVMETKM